MFCTSCLYRILLTNISRSTVKMSWRLKSSDSRRSSPAVRRSCLRTIFRRTPRTVRHHQRLRSPRRLAILEKMFAKSVNVLATTSSHAISSRRARLRPAPASACRRASTTKISCARIAKSADTLPQTAHIRSTFSRHSHYHSLILSFVFVTILVCIICSQSPQSFIRLCITHRPYAIRRFIPSSPQFGNHHIVLMYATLALSVRSSFYLVTSSSLLLQLLYIPLRCAILAVQPSVCKETVYVNLA